VCARGTSLSKGRERVPVTAGARRPWPVRALARRRASTCSAVTRPSPRPPLPLRPPRWPHPRRLAAPPLLALPPLAAGPRPRPPAAPRGRCRSVSPPCLGSAPRRSYSASSAGSAGPPLSRRRPPPPSSLPGGSPRLSASGGSAAQGRRPRGPDRHGGLNPSRWAWSTPGTPSAGTCAASYRMARRRMALSSRGVHAFSTALYMSMSRLGPIYPPSIMLPSSNGFLPPFYSIVRVLFTKKKWVCILQKCP